MSLQFNEATISGNLTRDPETRQTNSGSTVTDFGMALNRKYKSKDGTPGEETCFVDVSAWGRQGEIVAEYCRKGSPLFVKGRLKLDQWEKDGQKRSKLSVVAEKVYLNDAKRDDAQAPATSPAAPQAALAGSTDQKDQLPF